MILCIIVGIVLFHSFADSQSPYHTKAIPPGYSKFQAPQEGGQPAKLFIFLHVMDLDEINESTMAVEENIWAVTIAIKDFRIHLYLGELWSDPRLNLDRYLEDDPTVLPQEIVDNIWAADIVFDNSKAGAVFPEYVPTTVLKVRSDGQLYRSTRYTFRVGCQMKFENYPMDMQNCYLTIGSMGHPESKLQLYWVNEPDLIRYPNIESIFFSQDIHPLKYRMEKPRTSRKTSVFVSGNYTTLIANFTFVRYTSSQVINVYLPSTMIVFLSWISFWLDPENVPSRITLGVASLLTIITMVIMGRHQLPPINYMTALDLWLFFCTLLVFLSLLEFAFAYRLAGKRPKVSCRRVQDLSDQKSIFSSQWERVTNKKIMNQQVDSAMSTQTQESDERDKGSTPTRCCFLPSSLDSQIPDQLSRILFPFSFFCFAAAYWIYYLNM